MANRRQFVTLLCQNYLERAESMFAPIIWTLLQILAHISKKLNTFSVTSSKSNGVSFINWLLVVQEDAHVKYVHTFNILRCYISFAKNTGKLR